MAKNATSRRKILLVVTVGGITNAAPVLELGKVLASRGHTVEFATLEGQRRWLEGYECIASVYYLGPSPTEEQLDAHYQACQLRDLQESVLASKHHFDSFHAQTYKGLKALIENPATRPDMIIGDYFVEALKDIRAEHNDLPVAVVWPQIPYFMGAYPWIPREPDFQVKETPISKSVSMWAHMKNQLVVFKTIPVILKHISRTKTTRRKAEINPMVRRYKKPDYLVLVNSFFGLEPPRDLPPLVSAVGPILADEYPGLDDKYAEFLKQHKRTIYIALGTNVALPHCQFREITEGLITAIDDGLLDGVIWSIGKNACQFLDRSELFTIKGNQLALGELLGGGHADWLFPDFAPQRSILDHDNTRIYFTHGGGSSANEGTYHMTPMIVSAFSSDELDIAAKLEGSGCAEILRESKFTSTDVHGKIKTIIEDTQGSYVRNTERLSRIARVASRRKHLAADLVEELIYDTEGRFVNGKEMQPMHLQTADMRMPAYKAKNWDMYGLVTVNMGVLGGVIYYASRFAWKNRTVINLWVEPLVKGLLR